MHRRDLLAGVGAAVGLAGCISGPSDSEATPRPTEIVDWEHETGVVVDTEIDGTDEPVIAVDRDENAVVVEGVAAYSSSSCGHLAFLEPFYDPADAHLRVRVFDQIDEPESDEREPHGCGDDLATSSYRVVVRFDEGLPATVVAEEAEYSISTTRTIE